MQPIHSRLWIPLVGINYLDAQGQGTDVLEVKTETETHSFVRYQSEPNEFQHVVTPNNNPEEIESTTIPVTGLPSELMTIVQGMYADKNEPVPEDCLPLTFLSMTVLAAFNLSF